MAPADDRELKKGSADLLVLALLERDARHGYDLAHGSSPSARAGVLQFHVASLYPLLYRLERKGWIEGRWVEKAGQRRRRYYKLTAEAAAGAARAAPQLAGVRRRHSIASRWCRRRTMYAALDVPGVYVRAAPAAARPPSRSRGARSSRSWRSRWSRPTTRRGPPAAMTPPPSRRRAASCADWAALGSRARRRRTIEGGAGGPAYRPPVARRAGQRAHRPDARADVAGRALRAAAGSPVIPGSRLRRSSRCR